MVLQLEEVTWQTVAAELDGEMLSQFDWLRAGIPSQLRRDGLRSRIAKSIEWRTAVFSLAISFAICISLARVFS